jgi:HEAT repeat protein
MIVALGAEEEDRAILAAAALIGQGEAAVPALIQALGDANVLLRRRAIWPLQIIGATGAVSALIAALAYDEDAKVRRYAAWALGEMGGKRAIKPLIDAFGDLDGRVRWDAAVALEKIGSDAIMPLIYALHYGAPLVRVGAVNALAWIKNSSATHVLIGALKDRDAEVRTRAAFALGWLADRRAVKYLIVALHDPADEVRMQAALALGWIGDARAIQPLVEMMGEAHEWVPTAAVEALSHIKHDDAVEALIIACSFGNPQVRLRARRMLFQRGVEADTTPVIMPDKLSRLAAWANKGKVLIPVPRQCNLVIVN